MLTQAEESGECFGEAAPLKAATRHEKKRRQATSVDTWKSWGPGEVQEWSSQDP